jgi:hypothetical protein
LLALPEGGGDPASADVLLAFEAFGVDAQQDFHAVTGPLGDLRCRYSGTRLGPTWCAMAPTSSWSPR